jgi:hypothetical protein
MPVAATNWLNLIDLEYMRHFALEGGSAVKFAVGEDHVLAQIQQRLQALATDQGYVFVEVDGAQTKLHLIQDFFFALSKQIDWEHLAQLRIEALFDEHSFKWPHPGHVAPLAEIADINKVTENQVLLNADQWLARAVLRDREMAQDYREAMVHLCRRRMDSESGLHPSPVLDWLRGDLRLLSAIRPLQIGAKIGRHNGRAMLRSLCHWLQLCKLPGVVVTLDLRWIAERNASSAGIRYTPASVLDVFEVLRQLIDETERLEGLVIVVVASPALLEGSDARRTLDKYPALKGRIGFDVRAQQHDNPVAPLVRVADHADDLAITTSGAMPFSAEREALRAGVPNESAIRLLGAGEDVWSSAFVEDLRTIARAAGKPPVLEGRIVSGGFGTGKSHLLGALAQHGQNQNFIVSPISISKETPLFNLERVYAAAVRAAIVPDINDDVMSVVIGRLDTRSVEFESLEEWASSPSSGLSTIFAALLHILSRNVLGPEDKIAVARFLAGARLPLGRINLWLNACGARKLFQVRAVKAQDLALQRFRFAPALFRAAGFSGWCVLLDEAELIGRYSTLQRAKSYAELCRWLALDGSTAVPGLISVATLVDDFKSVVLEGRLDEEKVPILLESKGLDEALRMAEIGMRAINSKQHVLASPNSEQLLRDLDVVKKLYQRSYDWAPPAPELGEQRAGKTMREYIKSWITDWDIQRLYGEKDAIITVPFPHDDMTENRDFETQVAELPDDLA